MVVVVVIAADFTRFRSCHCFFPLSCWPFYLLLLLLFFFAVQLLQLLLLLLQSSLLSRLHVSDYLLFVYFHFVSPHVRVCNGRFFLPVCVCVCAFENLCLLFFSTFILVFYVRVFISISICRLACF